MSNISVQSSFINTLQARVIAGAGLVQSSPLRVSGAVVGHPAVTALTATGNVAAASLFNGLLSVAPTANPSTYTLPASAAVLAAFTAAGVSLSVGDVFETKVQNTGAANGAQFAIGADIIAGTALEPIPARKSALLVFYVNNVTLGAEQLSVYQLVSA